MYLTVFIAIFFPAPGADGGGPGGGFDCGLTREFILPFGFGGGRRFAGFGSSSSLFRLPASLGACDIRLPDLAGGVGPVSVGLGFLVDGLVSWSSRLRVIACLTTGPRIAIAVARLSGCGRRVQLGFLLGFGARLGLRSRGLVLMPILGFCFICPRMSLKLGGATGGRSGSCAEARPEGTPKGAAPEPEDDPPPIIPV